MKKSNLLLINGSRHHKSGQSYFLVQKIMQEYHNAWDIDILNLKGDIEKKSWKEKISNANAYIFLTGTYWDSWGSPLQYFLEEATEWEGTDLWLGKSAAVIVTMHSVGGKAVLSRLQGVLNNFGLSLPPMSGMVLSLAANLAINGQSSECGNVHFPDLWSLKDLDVIMKNLELSVSVQGLIQYQAWETDKNNFEKPWL
jgi:hypothetical protein